MDVKSMAKSKRSHTQHHQPRKPKNNPSSSSSTASATTAAKKDGREKKKGTTRLPPQQPSLPSNWGRYDHENDDDDDDDDEEVSIDSGSDDPSQLGDLKSKKRVDVDEVKPKSKGADFSKLIAQANESRSYYSPSFDDQLPEFYQGAAPMFAVRGEKIVLQNRDDDFLMEDEASGTQEAPFLTLDLEDLAERLSKIDLAKRLFIEQDLFLPELHGQDTSDVDNQVSSQTPKRQNIERIDSFGELLALYLEEERMAKRQDGADKDSMMFLSNVSSCHNPDLEPESKSEAVVTVSKLNDLDFLDAKGKVQVDHVGEEDANNKLDVVGQVSSVPKQIAKSKLEDLEFLDERENPEASHVTGQDTRPLSTFEASSAEAELDMLLGSFNETKLFDSPMNQPGTSASYMTGNIATHGAPLQHSLSHSAPAFPVTSSLDDELDDLLAETSIPNNKDGLFQSTQVPSSSVSQSSSKSKVLEDFDSWLETI